MIESATTSQTHPAVVNTEYQDDLTAIKSAGSVKNAEQDKKILKKITSLFKGKEEKK